MCRQTYNAGALLFFTSIAVLLVPPGPVDSARRAVIVLALAAVSIEAAWLTGSSLRSKQRIGRLPVVLTPATYAIMAFVIVRFTTAAYASQAAAAAGIAIAGVAAATASIRLVIKGNHACLQAVGIAIAAASISAALAAVLLLQAHWRHAVLDTEITAVTLIVFLAATAFPKQTLKSTAA